MTKKEKRQKMEELRNKAKEAAKEASLKAKLGYAEEARIIREMGKEYVNLRREMRKGSGMVGIVFVRTKRPEAEELTAEELVFG